MNRKMLKLNCYLAILFVLFLVPVSGDKSNWNNSWNRTFGGPYGDGAWSLQETKDGGYIIAGYTCSPGNRGDLWLIKTETDGKEQWNRVFGGSDEDVGYFVKETRDGGYIVTGSTKSYGIGEERVWLLKTDSDGIKEWDRTFAGFVSSSGDGGWSVDETDDGYIITGYTRSDGSGGKDLWLIKTDSQGVEQWQKTFGGSKDDVGMTVARAHDGGYIVAGRTASFSQGDDDIWLLKVETNGKEQWNRTYGGEKNDVCFQVVSLDDGYALAGRTESADGKRAFLLKTDLLGRKIWERTYGKDSTGISLQRTDDDGFIIAGSTETKGRGKDALLIKTDSNGKEKWMETIGGTRDDIGTSVVQSRDGGFVLAGITSSYGEGAEDAWLVKLIPDNISGNAISKVEESGDSISKNATVDNVTKDNITLENTILENTMHENLTISENTTNMELQENASRNITNQKIAANKIIWNIPKLADDRMPNRQTSIRSAKSNI